MVYVLFIVLSLLGVGLRYLSNEHFGEDFLFPSLFVNLIGSFLIGGAYAFQGSFWFFPVAVGFLGALTTFSGFTLEIFKLIQGQNYILAIGYGSFMLITSVFFCAIGYHLSLKLYNI